MEYSSVPLDVSSASVRLSKKSLFIQVGRQQRAALGKEFYTMQQLPHRQIIFIPGSPTHDLV